MSGSSKSNDSFWQERPFGKRPLPSQLFRIQMALCEMQDLQDRIHKHLFAKRCSNLSYIFGMPPKVNSRVLVVDDNRDAADMLAILIQMAGGEVTETGIALARASPPNFIFS